MSFVKAETARFSRAVALSTLAFTLMACSGLDEKRLEYRQGQSIGALEIPAGLEAPHSDSMLNLPPVSSDMVEVDPKPPVNLPAELLVQPEDSEEVTSNNKKVKKPAQFRGFELD